MLQGAPIPLLFEIARSGATGKVRLSDGRRTVTLAVRRRNVVGVKGLPELWDRIQGPGVDTSTCRGHLLQDIPRLMACGVPIDDIFEEAVFSLGRFLADLADHDDVAVFREIPEPLSDSVGLPKSLMAVVVEGLRTFRQPRSVRRGLAVDQDRPLVVGRITPDQIARWDSEAAKLLRQASDYATLDSWLVHIDRAPRGRQDQFWRALDLLLQIGAVELKGSRHTPMAVRSVSREDRDSTTPSVSGFSEFSVAPEVPRFLLDLESSSAASASGPSSSSARTSMASEAAREGMSWRRSEKVTLGEPDLFELPPDDDESSVASRRSRPPPIEAASLDDHDDVFALPPDDDSDELDAPLGSGLDDHDDVFALPPDDDDSDDGSSPSVVSFTPTDGQDLTTEHDPIVKTTIIDDDSEHVVRPLFTPRKRKKKT